MLPVRYALVLGGGGLKGLAHIGVLAAIEEIGHRPVQIVGTSVGALIAAAWCSGLSAAELTDIARELRRRDLFRVAHRDMAMKRMLSPALYRPEPMQHFVRGLLGDLTFDELDRPVLVNTVDLNSGTQVFWGAPGLRDVPVADAVLASCALPGYLPPTEIQGRYFFDGATVSNLPVEAAATGGNDLVLAVDVGAAGRLRAETERAGFAAIYARAIEIAIEKMRTTTLRHWQQPPLLLIQPRVEHIDLFSFSHNAELVREGHRAALELLQNPEAIPAADQRGVFPRRPYRVRVQRERCIGCRACLVHGPPGLFVLDDEGKAVVTQPDQVWSPVEAEAVRQCPTYAIAVRSDGADPGAAA